MKTEGQSRMDNPDKDNTGQKHTENLKDEQHKPHHKNRG
jgi:hypothetical protein